VNIDLPFYLLFSSASPSVRLGFAGALPELDGDIASRKQPARALPLANSGHPSSDRKG
jgi:hypothetical protein